METSGRHEYRSISAPNRIPNYKGAQAACQNITKLNEFQTAKSIKAEHGLINHIEVPKAANKEALRSCASHDGINEFGREIDLDEEVRVDLVITGCVAVSKDGWRIGKGEGFADLEYAMMLSLRIITPETLVIASVHDSQVVEIPQCIIQPYDMPVDIIVTPTQVIKCPRRERTPGIIWSEPTVEKLTCIPILNVLREREYASGADVTLRKVEGTSSVVRGRSRGYESRRGRGGYRYEGRGLVNREYLSDRETSGSYARFRGVARYRGGRGGYRGTREGVKFARNTIEHPVDTSKYEVISFT